MIEHTLFSKILMNSLANVLPLIIQTGLLDYIADLGLDFLIVANKASFYLRLVLHHEALNGVCEIIYNHVDIAVSCE
jgi:LytS/YehU family sensor histidine kinase